MLPTFMWIHVQAFARDGPYDVSMNGRSCCEEIAFSPSNRNQATCGGMNLIQRTGRIAEIGEGSESRDTESIDATDTVRHARLRRRPSSRWESLFRNFGEGGPAETPSCCPRLRELAPPPRECPCRPPP